jgi:hypothetical protein
VNYYYPLDWLNSYVAYPLQFDFWGLWLWGSHGHWVQCDLVILAPAVLVLSWLQIWVGRPLGSWLMAKWWCSSSLWFRWAFTCPLLSAMYSVIPSEPWPLCIFVNEDKITLMKNDLTELPHELPQKRAKNVFGLQFSWGSQTSNCLWTVLVFISTYWSCNLGSASWVCFPVRYLVSAFFHICFQISSTDVYPPNSISFVLIMH